MKRVHLVSACLSVLVVAACGSNPSQPEVHHPKVPQGSTIAVISFRDCTMAEQDDCAGSGDKVTDIFMSELINSRVFHTDKLPRPVGTAADLSDDSAAAYAKQKGYAYVINGEVTDYYKLHWFRKERAAVVVRVLSVADGKILYVHTDSNTSSSSSGTPDDMFKNMADDVQDDIEDN